MSDTQWEFDETDGVVEVTDKDVFNMPDGDWTLTPRITLTDNGEMPDWFSK